ncbi:hypothetical protein [Streptomyces sp. NBC_00847]|uniref:hypothetical protein n=1 Tax=Streptomyces sp. NBC_00847 TaxID=2975850 RepID=UPI00224F7614|nr:hypothetical protein [Streptomyces sp. NBC_00847]MCX4880119.1 hypothetical protein [Streptomyces sp. NBC_00847]
MAGLTTCGPTRRPARATSTDSDADLVEAKGTPDTRRSFCHFDAARLADLEVDVLVL